jgi:putative PIN family toxin of toxin-antitoxin system
VRIVFYTNVLVSGILTEGLCREIVEIHLPDHTPILSRRLWDELVKVLEEKFGLTPDGLPLLGLYHRLATWVEPSELKPPVCRDRDDDWVLATALAGEADAIVTGDDDLLSLRRHRSLAILSPRQFLKRLHESQ